MDSDKYSSYFDNGFNFNNIVQPSKEEMVDKLKYMSCTGNIMLEPRLQEYIKRKQFHKNNNVTPCISPEKEFQITSQDKRILREYLSGNRDIYSKYTLEKGVNCERRKRYFPSKEFRDDARVPDIEKMKPTHNTPANMGMFAPEPGKRHYDNPVIRNNNLVLDARDFPDYDGSGYDVTESRFSPRIDPKIDRGYERNNKHDSQYRIPEQPRKVLDPDPRNRHIISDLSNKQRYNNNGIASNKHQFSEYCDTDGYKDYGLIDNHEKQMHNARYGNDLTPTYNMASEMDLDNKVVIPNMSSKSKKDLNSGNYRFESYFGKSSCRDTEMESDLVRGMPTYRPHNRSYGYRNPAENYYDYLDDDFQGPDSSVEPWERGGEPTRLTNKNAAKSRVYNRDVM